MSTTERPTDSTLRERHPLSLRVYAGTIGIFFLLGFAAASLGVAAVQRSGLLWLPVLLGLGGAYAGFEVASRADRWTYSLAAHLLMSLAVGLATAPLFLFPLAAPLREVAVLAMLGVAVMTMAAWVHPFTVRAFGTFLLGGIAAWVLYPSAFSAAPPALGLPERRIVEAIVATLFCAYVDFYWTQALKEEPTLDGAADTAAGLFIDPLRRLLARLERTAERRRFLVPR